MQINPIPIIAIDGTTASGKGTIAYKLAEHFKYHYLNSGALYRLTAYLALRDGVAIEDVPKVAELAKNLAVTFVGKEVLVDSINIWPILSTQEYGGYASIVSMHPEIREALLGAQRAMVQEPGLVAEGRDMCTNVFIDACVKLYLDGTVEARAKRRYKDEVEKNTGKSLSTIEEEIRVRDERDKNKPVGALFPAEDAVIIDTTKMTIDEVVMACIQACKEKGITAD